MSNNPTLDQRDDLTIEKERSLYWRGIANRLKRENAALRRDVYQCPPTSENDYEGFKWRDACEELERENAMFRRALADALSTFQHEDEVIVTAERVEAWKAALSNGSQ